MKKKKTCLPSVSCRRGFTLIELIVAVVIVGIVVLVGVSAWRGARSQARDAQRLADIRQISAALKLYFDDCESYPDQSVAIGGQSLASGGSDCVGGGFLDQSVSGAVYLSNVPAAPNPPDRCDSQKNEYFYSGSGGSFSITFCLGSETQGLAPGSHVATERGIK